MARKMRMNGETETEVDPYTSGTPVVQTDIIDTTAELVNMSPMRPSAVERDAATAVVAPTTKFVVERDAFVMNRGCRVRMHRGKVVDKSNFDLASLRQQGVILTELPPSQQR